MGPLTRLAPAETAWRRHVRSFAETKVAPLVAEMDAAAALDPGLREALFAAELMAVEVPTRYGGAGRDLFAVVLAIEEVARVCAGVAVCVDVQNALVNAALLRWGTEPQRDRWLPRLAAGTVGAYAISEAGAGSDASAMTTVAEPTGDGFVLTGRKKWTSNAAEAGLFLVFARLATSDPANPRTSAFLVERDRAGVAVEGTSDQLGVRAAAVGDLVLDGVRVESKAVLGRPGGGGALAMETLSIGRVGIAAQLVGLAQGALESALGYAQTRRQYGQRIAAFQGVQFPLAQTATEVEAARALVYSTARLFAAAPSPAERLRAAAMAKLFASQVAERAASQAVEVFGGNGYVREYPAEKRYRDAKVGAIYEGTSNIQLRTIASTLLQGAARTAVSMVDEGERAGGR